ncbi:ABC transporter ATP-binding protein [Saccharothrix algeriensis]|uniref:Multidrug ABC transporter ATP-binding protein n=2 Tax=Catellatospora bangladeshensis TaxID=310355 RepID=A0A8J3JEC2_9ACTN|nr:ABC transporter ATP-binding protein [Catellatospora bangladeshensis]GIF79096.1 multidrug ABC transporter ATP-binding protein [Catellatospora bangladeshensis]
MTLAGEEAGAKPEITGRDVLARGARVMWRGIRDEPRRFTLAVTGSCLFGALVIGQALVVGWVVDTLVAPATTGGDVATGAIALCATVLIAMGVGRVFGIFGRRLGAGFMQFALQARYRHEVTRRYLQLPLSWHQRHPTGTLLSNANSDVEAAWFPVAPLPFAVGTVFMLFVAVTVLFAIDWALALVGLVVFPVLFVMNVIFSRRMAPRQARAQHMRAEVAAIAHESFDGALVVKTMGREDLETQRFARRAGELRDALISVGRLRGLFDPLMESLPFLGTLLALLVGAWRLDAGAIDLQQLVQVTFLFTVLAFPVRAIGWVLGDLPRSVAGWDRVEQVLRSTGQMPYGAEALTGAGAAQLRFEHVDFAYEPGQPVLRDVTFTVPAGKTVALVGPTGSGKSTIATLAARLLDPDGGQVSLDAADARTLTAASLADTVALVPQIAFVFDDTVRGNVALDRPGVDEDRVRHALATAQADTFVARLPEELDTQLGERGTSLSGGQRQRLTLARALAGQPRLLVLDDATSAVDPRVEARILASLRGAAQATTILVVAYRRATIALADEVVYIESGRVVASGTHEQLLASVPGYIELVTAYEKAEEEREREHVYDADGDAETSVEGGVAA